MKKFRKTPSEEWLKAAAIEEGDHDLSIENHTPTNPPAKHPPQRLDPVWIGVNADGRPDGQIYEYDPTGIRNDFTEKYVPAALLQEERARAFKEALAAITETQAASRFPITAISVMQATKWLMNRLAARSPGDAEK